MSDQNKKNEDHISLQDLQNTVATKKQEAAEIAEQSAVLAKENNVPINIDPDEMPQGDKFLAAIGYFSFLCILPLVLRPKSEFCQFHGKQGLVMLVFFMIFGWILRIFGSLAFGSYVLIHNLVILVHVGFAIWAVYYAFKGVKKSLPLFGGFVKNLDW